MVTSSCTALKKLLLLILSTHRQASTRHTAGDGLGDAWRKYLKKTCTRLLSERQLGGSCQAGVTNRAGRDRETQSSAGVILG